MKFDCLGIQRAVGESCMLLTKEQSPGETEQYGRCEL